MKQIIFSFFILCIVYGCTSYDDDVKEDIQDFRTLTTENIETDLKVANLIVDQEEFDNMYANFLEEIEIDGFLNLYKNGVALIENEVIEIEIKGAFSTKFPLKTLGIKFDDTYNNEDRKLIDVEPLPFHSLDRIKAFRFRNSGNDFERTMLKDMSYTKPASIASLV